uniref:Transcription factor ILR3-like n=1 Tax=Nelumbo nucifera TaxID=4432 RepID=A0A822ZDF0_NELNU|nr:TPA_asm: hypothetical protein HUJ06_015379 [Nelumbo nucifera]
MMKCSSWITTFALLRNLREYERSVFLKTMDEAANAAAVSAAISERKREESGKKKGEERKGKGKKRNRGRERNKNIVHLPQLHDTHEQRPPKMDKAAILTDAVRMVIQLRSKAQKLKESNESLLEKIKELKAEKNELRDEKQRLKTEREAGTARVAMWQFMPPAAVDTSQDHVLRPPVA